MQSKQFIEQLAAQQLLSPSIIDELRRQVAEVKSRLTPEMIAKLLVDNGHLTKFQATKLIADFKGVDAEREAPSKPRNDFGSELDFLPDEEQLKPSPSAIFVADEAPVEVMPIEEVVEVVDAEPVEIVEASVRPSRSTAGAATPPKPISQKPKTQRAVRPRHIEVSARVNPWDSFRIMGVALLLALAVIFGGWLTWSFWKGDAKQMLANADETYKQRSRLYLGGKSGSLGLRGSKTSWPPQAVLRGRFGAVLIS